MWMVVQREGNAMSQGDKCTKLALVEGDGGSRCDVIDLILENHLVCGKMTFTSCSQPKVI